MFHPRAIAVVIVFLTALLVGSPGPGHAAVDHGFISDLVIRYADDAPTQHIDDLPRGAQCVERRFRGRLTIDRGIGAGMYVVRIEPAVAPAALTKIVRQLARCPGILWAEAPVVQFLPQAARRDGGGRTM